MASQEEPVEVGVSLGDTTHTPSVGGGRGEWGTEVCCGSPRGGTGQGVAPGVPAQPAPSPTVKEGFCAPSRGLRRRCGCGGGCWPRDVCKCGKFLLLVFLMMLLK